MKKILSKFLIIIILCLGILGAWKYGLPILIKEDPLVLNGESEVVLTLNTTYEELGANQECEIKGEVDTSKEGVYTLQYVTKDQELQRIVRVVDDKRMVMNLNGDPVTRVKVGEKYIESNCHVIDFVDGNLSSQVKVSGEVDTTKPNDYILTYEVTNSAGYTLKKERTVKVLSAEDFGENIDGVPVCMLHWVYSADDEPENLDSNWILDTTLEEYCKFLHENNFYFPSYQELAAYIKGEISLPQKSIIMNFDDGRDCFLELGIPILEKYQIPATSFVIGINNGENKVKKYASEYITFQSHSYDMHKGGGYIGHGGIVSAMDEDEILEDLLKSQEIVQNKDAYCYPYGDITDEAISAVEKAGFICAFTTVPGRCYVGDPLFELNRVRIQGYYTLEDFQSLVD